MPNIREQEVTSEGLRVVFSDGKEVTVAKMEIADRFANDIGDRIQRRLATRLWARTRVADVGTIAQIDPAYVDFDFREGDGTPTLLEFRNPIQAMSAEQQTEVGNIVMPTQWDQVRGFFSYSAWPPTHQNRIIECNMTPDYWMCRTAARRGFGIWSTQIKAIYAGTTGTPEERRIATRINVLNQLEAAIGSEAIHYVKEFDFDEGTGRPSFQIIIG